ncbi:MAG: ABC transporter permease subunit [Micromonosporaceae bacterium]|nr:ABC transporter permease subunit [Micromonosporaceae bacterium]
MVRVEAQPAGSATTSRGAGRWHARRLVPYAGVLPFLGYAAVFLLWPTYIVLAGAFQDTAGRATVDNVRTITSGATYLDAFARSIELSVVTALLGAVLGALLSWAIAQGRPDGVLRRAVVSASGVLAQFGGVMLAFAFLATFGFNGLVTIALQDWLGVDVFSSGAWIYGFTGLAVVYTYFQIPLMVIVFLPAIDGLKPQWREASDGLGGSGWAYWRHVGGPILAPSFLGATLLLFANAFSAYATAAALISQGSPLVTLQIRASLTSEVVLGQASVGKALALGMIVVVAVVMSLYALLQRRTARWLR